ncbi:UbiH/UbiF/VisC/COQ6 family ubiquinone biosynthesis hydroxylase [Ketobacter sp.]|uniref:UbiH/UbiF/VisC/COQ6 family ubiquinone biosynthesis hydroxylase n=1 Tax=Ketobacter sp. TaxID=2083498 RepID=UPI0025C5F6A9|nr:UbiH/UbiF/VisC/COQ6 family ubiquinone biosynthesis hydroxylase [Ketobacter sp.]
MNSTPSTSSPSTSWSGQPDILIVGAGMAGLTLAAALAEQPVSVQIIDPQLPDGPERWPNSFDPRVSALTQASENMLRRLGAWPAMAAQRVAPFAHMDVWDGDGTGNIQFHAAEAGATHLGHIVENRVTTHALYERVLAASNVEVIATGLDKILENEQGGWRILLSDGRALEPTLLIGADGARSRVRDQLGFRCRTWSYGQSAIVTTVQTAQPHGDTARQVFLESGPLAFLPLREQSTSRGSCLSSIVWTLDDDQLEPVMALSEAEFCARLGQAFEQRLGPVLNTDRRFAFPLLQNHAVDYIQPGVALLGDAAHTIHPLAGQGINLGLLDAAVLAEEIQRALQYELPLDDFSILRRYQRRRKPHNLLLMSTMEGFKRLFGVDVPPLRVVRNLGMSFCNRHSLIKGQIMARAMGMEGDLPALAQPGLVADF